MRILTKLLSVLAFVVLNVVAATFVLVYALLAGAVAIVRSCIRIWHLPRVPATTATPLRA